MSDDLLGLAAWTRPEVTHVGRLPMRSPLIPAPDVDTARDATAPNPWVRSLDGRWRFRLVDAPARAPKGFMRTDHEDHDWAEVDVPGLWTMQGFDRPIYTNVQMPFHGVPPQVPADNPTGLYRTGFKVPKRWIGRRIVLHVGAADSVLHVWVNGHAVGISKDSRLEAAFDVTEHVHRGENLLALMVVRWSDASYVEDQDQWWHAGIGRGVRLTATDDVWIEDVHARGDWDLVRGVGALHVRTEVGFAPKPRRGWSVRVQLETVAGRRVGPARTAPIPTDRRAYVFHGHVAELDVDDLPVRPWSAEVPDRYRLVVSLLDDAGETREVTACTVGFRSIEIRDRELLLNGEPVLLARRQPPRLRPRHRARGDRRADAGGSRADEAVRLQRGAHVTRAERPRLLRPVRRARPLRGRRDELRESRVHLLGVRRPARTRPRCSTVAAAW